MFVWEMTYVQQLTVSQSTETLGFLGKIQMFHKR